MAEQTVVDRRRSVALPPETDVATVAAAMNPAMSSWIALRSRIAMQPGQRVLVLGATGNAGAMAVEIAKHLGAGLWGTPAEHAIRAILTRRRDRSRPLDWIQIGSVAGPDIALPSAALRAANLRIMGSGQGSVSTAAIVAELPALAAEITAGTLTVNAVPTPLSEVETAWNAPTASGQRVVFTP